MALCCSEIFSFDVPLNYQSIYLYLRKYETLYRETTQDWFPELKYNIHRWSLIKPMYVLR